MNSLTRNTFSQSHANVSYCHLFICSNTCTYVRSRAYLFLHIHIEDNWNSISFAILYLANAHWNTHTRRERENKKKINKFIIVVIFFVSCISMRFAGIAALLYANFASSYSRMELRFTFPHEYIVLPRNMLYFYSATRPKIVRCLYPIWSTNGKYTRTFRIKWQKETRKKKENLWNKNMIEKICMQICHV